MNPKTKNELLKNFFAAYFHEDWQSEAKTPEEVIRIYKRSGATREALQALSEGIVEYSRRFENAQELETSLFKEMGCYYAPSFDGISPFKWLQDVAIQLLEDREPGTGES